MRKLINLLLVTGILGIGISFAADSESTPVYKDGDQWVYRLTIRRGNTQDSSFTNGDYNITYQNGEFKGDSTTFLEKVATVNLQGSKIKWLNLPLKSGKKWSFSSVREVFGKGRGKLKFLHVESNVEVLGTEPIETTAGKFTDAVEIRRKDTGGRNWEFKYFYSPVSKSVVKIVACRENKRGKLKKMWEAELIKYSIK